MSQSTDSFRDSFNDDDEGDALHWNPRDEGSNSPNPIIGTLRDIELRAGHGDYPPYPVLLIGEEDTGTVWQVRCTHTALRSQLEECKPRPGERVGIQHLGQRTSASGRTYEAYRVKVDRHQTREPSRGDAPPALTPSVPARSAYDDDDGWGSLPDQDPPF